MKDINFLFSESITEKMEDTEKKKTGISIGKIILAVLVSLIAVGILLAPGLYLSSIKTQVEKAEASLLDPKYTEVRNVKARLESTTAELNKKKAVKLSGKADSSRVVSELISNLDRLHTLSRMTESVTLEQTQSPVKYNISYGVSVKGGK